MSEDFKDVHQERIDFLLKEYDEHRDAIKDMITDLEKIRKKIDILIPESLDARYVRFFEEKVKSMTGLFNSLLEMRKEIAKSVKDEIEIRRRIKTNDDLVDVEDMLDIRSMAKKIDDFKEKTESMRKKRWDELSKQKLNKDIQIPGLTDEKGRKINDEQNS